MTTRTSTSHLTFRSPYWVKFRIVCIRRLFVTMNDVNAVLEQLIRTGNIKGVTSSVLFSIIRDAHKDFGSNPVLLDLNPPITICGDIHGQFDDLLEIFNKIGQPGQQLPSTKYLFLGDYVDRGTKSVETITLLFCYRLKFKRNFFLLRGNHETSCINAIYGFRKELNKKFGLVGEKLWENFNMAFSQMPITALVGGRILCMHGGISPHLKNLKELRQIKRGWKDPKESGNIAIDLLWSDPDTNIKGWQSSSRGCSFVFGNDVLISFCRKHDIDLIVRGHEVVQDGYRMHPTKQLITIFSAPNYCGQFNNAGAVMQINPELGCSFTQFHSKEKATPIVINNIFDERIIQQVENPPPGTRPLVIAPSRVGESATVVFLPIAAANSPTINQPLPAQESPAASRPKSEKSQKGSKLATKSTGGNK
uniref:Serine/threonine-protein phosphatase n=2 Tax=Meloidogyne TaxID=189290 RepID=A0A6V7TPC2_MELEN|nr:unnamed protein product [Meloidogyne enterolobii]